ncbi:MAG: hypothetical protein ACTSPR_07795, partial [Candidatus Thorarchaeota archaeon]
LISQIAETEGPVHTEVVAERVRQCYSLGRLRGSSRDYITRAIQAAQRRGATSGDGSFIWARDDQLRRLPRLPVDGNIEHVPPTELRAVAISVAKAVFGIPRPDLVTEIARRLGFNRTGDRIETVLSTMVQALLTEGKLVESFGMLHAQAPDLPPESGERLNSAAAGGYEDDSPNVHLEPNETSLIQHLRGRGLEVVDKRNKGGALWVIGGLELRQWLHQLKDIGVRFTFAPGGGQATKKHAAWWTRSSS